MLSLPASGMYANVYSDIEMLLDDEAMSLQEDDLAVQNLFNVCVSDTDIFGLNVTHEEADIQLGLGWSWESPVANDNNCDVVGMADRTAKSGPIVDPIIATALKSKISHPRKANTPVRIVEDILNVLIDDVVYARPEDVVRSIVDEIFDKAVPRPLPPPKRNKDKKVTKTQEKQQILVNPGAKSGSAAPKNVAVEKNRKPSAIKEEKVAREVASNVEETSSLPLKTSARTYGRVKRVAHVPLSPIFANDPTFCKPLMPKNPAPKPTPDSPANVTDSKKADRVVGKTESVAGKVVKKEISKQR